MIFILASMILSLAYMVPTQAMGKHKLDPDLKQKANTVAQAFDPHNQEFIQAYANQEQFKAECAATKKDIELIRSTELIELYAKNKLTVSSDNHIHFDQHSTAFTSPFEYASKTFSESIAISQHDIKAAIQRIRNQTKTNQDPTVRDIYLAMSGYLQWLIKQDSESLPDLCAKNRIAIKDALLKSDIEKFKSITISENVSDDAFAASRTQYFLEQ